jgi:Phospholipase_D-nuclease N-terminal
MSWFWWLIGVIIVALWVVTIVDIVRRRHQRTAAKTAAWVIAVIVFPVGGTIVYFLVNGAGGNEGAPRGDMRPTPRRS